MRRLPLGSKLAFTVFIAVWLPVIVRERGWQNLLWLCDLANLVVLWGLWAESALLLSSQLVAVLLVDLLWVADLAAALVTGSHPIGGTEYMLDAGVPALVRALSLYHVFVPLLLFLGVRRLGWDPRGTALQVALTWAVLPASFALADRNRNVNWVHGPFGRIQETLPPLAYLALEMVLLPVVLYLPVHWTVSRLARRGRALESRAR